MGTGKFIAGKKVIASRGISNMRNMANPASVFAKEQGLKSEIVTAPDGSQSGWITLPSGAKVEEWAYYRENYVRPTPISRPKPIRPIPKPRPIPIRPSPVPIRPIPKPIYIDPRKKIIPIKKEALSRINSQYSLGRKPRPKPITPPSTALTLTKWKKNKKKKKTIKESNKKISKKINKVNKSKKQSKYNAPLALRYP